jgi:hypothetical protein
MRLKVLLQRLKKKCFNAVLLIQIRDTMLFDPWIRTRGTFFRSRILDPVSPTHTSTGLVAIFGQNTYYSLSIGSNFFRYRTYFKNNF